MSKRAEAAWVVLGFACLAVAASYPLVRHPASQLPSDLGDPLLTTWTLAWDADRIRAGFAGIWDAPNFYPYRHTLLFSDHLLGIALFTAPLQWLTGNPVLVYNVAFLASFILAGGGMYVLVRDLTGRRDAALVAAAIYASQPFRISHVAHLQWLMTGWLPLSLWALHRYFTRRTWPFLLLSALFYLIASLTASYFAYFALVPLIVVGLWEVIRTRPPLRQVTAHTAVAAVLAAVVLLPVVRAYSQVRSDYDLRRSSADIAGQSADVADYFSSPPALHLWPGIGPGRGEHELFPGAVAFGLAALAVVACRRAAAVRLYAALAVLAFALSLGAAPAAWGHRLGVPGPYALLLAIVPGLDGLRAVARLAVFVHMALAVLAGFGSLWLFERLGTRGRRVALVALLGAAVAEGWAAPIRIAPFNPKGDPKQQEAYAYLRRLPAGAVMELPTSVTREEAEFAYQYMTLIHRHPVVNGHSGYLPQLHVFLGSGNSPWNELDHLDDAIAMLRGLDVRYLVVHRGAFDDAAVADKLLEILAPDRKQVVADRTFGDITVATLAPADPVPVPDDVSIVPTTAINARTSHSPDRLPLLFDGDADSRWLSGRRQSGDEWIALDLDRPRDIRVVRLQLAARSFGDYPRELAVDVVEEGGTRTLFHGPALPSFARGLVADGTHPFIDIVLPDNRARTVRLRQLGTTHSFFWSIHELRLLERL
jgi:hypothetical protein